VKSKKLDIIKRFVDLFNDVQASKHDIVLNEIGSEDEEGDEVMEDERITATKSGRMILKLIGCPTD